MSTVKVNAITDASGGNTATINSMTPTADSLQGFRNRIINGDMRIAQRGTASVATDDTLPVDRWKQNMVGGGVLTSNQSTTAPTGFNNSTLITVTTIDSSIAAGDYYNFNQRIEGFNVADLGFGTASAKTVTLSFWVRSSVTGTFAGCLANSAANRSYTFTYSISSANTFEYKTITITGDTTGTWLTDNGIGLRVVFDLGSGSDFQGTANSWQSGFKSATSTSVKLISTLNATWFITGVQLEVGSIATPFERRPYGTELALCQRYLTVIPATSYIPAYGTSSTTGYCIYNPPVALRVAPTGISTTVSGNLYSGTTARALTNLTFTGASTASVLMTGTVASGITPEAGTMLYTANAIQLTGCEL